MSQGFTLRKCQREDLSRVSEFRKAFFEYDPLIRSREPEYYDWKCHKNPIQPGEMWLAEDGDVLIGMKSMTPKRIKVLGEVVDGAETGDTFTHPDYQRRGIFTGLFKAARENGLDGRIDFIYGLPNRNSLPAYEKKLDYGQIPIKLDRLVKPLVPQRFLKRKLPLPLLATGFSLIMEIVSRAMTRTGTRGTGKSDVLVSQEPTFPDDIDTLWQRASQNYEVALVRTKDYLEWRYVANPDTYTILIARSQGGAILGYMVTKIGLYYDIPMGYIVDFLTLEHDPAIFKKLLATSIGEFYQRRVNLISTWAIRRSHYGKTLLRSGFFPLRKVTLICYKKSQLGSQVINNPHKWHFTIGDSDNI